MESHAEFLRRVTGDEELSGSIKIDYRRAELTDQELAMLTYVEKLTLNPSSMTRDDIEKLRNAGFCDQAILQINMIASWFNYINRVADGLGVGRDRMSLTEHADGAAIAAK